MTRIDFYTHVADPLSVVARLTAKIFSQRLWARILTPDADTTDRLDQLLWKVPATGFLPHCRLTHPLAFETPVLIDHVLEHEGRADVLINLHSQTPPFFGRFERLAEIVAADEAGATAGRARYRFYRERGYPLHAHDLADA